MAAAAAAVGGAGGPAPLAGRTVVVLGGTSGVGLHTTFQVAALGARVVGASRSADAVERAAGKAAQRAGAERIGFEQADALDEAALDRLFGRMAPVDHVVVSVLDRTVHDQGTFAKVGVAGIEAGFGKFWASCHAVHAALPHAAPNASFTLLSGADERKAWPGVVSHAVVGGALKALAKTLAVELAPMRVNVVNPGPTVDLEYDPVERPERIERLGRWGERFPLRRVGGAHEVASAVVALLCNDYVTGAVLDVDGGAAL